MSPIVYIIGGIVAFLGLMALVIGSGITQPVAQNTVDVDHQTYILVGQVQQDVTNVGRGMLAMKNIKIDPSTVMFNGAPQYGTSGLPAAFVTTPGSTVVKQIFDPNHGKVSPAPTAPADAFATAAAASERVYFYQKNISLLNGTTQLGTSAAEILMVVPNVTAAVCLAWRQKLNNDALTTTPDTDVPSSGLSLAEWVGTAAKTATAVLNQGVPRMNDCLRTTDTTTSYVLYATIQVY
jgi:hypothetical protein